MTRTAFTRREIEVRRMFDRLSGRYDLMNRLISLGQDRRWRRALLKRAGFSRIAARQGRVLDVGTGTGRIPMEALGPYPGLRVTGADFSPGMIHQGKRRCPDPRISWCSADALQLPFREATFDAVTSAYLMRNVSDPKYAFEEQFRVVKPGGVVACLETSPPSRSFLYPLVRFHLRKVIPFLGRIISREAGAYTYLPDTTQGFVTPEGLAAIMARAGLEQVSYQQFMFGVMAIHVGRRPP
ncbi:MAG: ubiquinone/menaquinone biosynthesis methyltransferase [Desulfobacteraceae bacterium]